MWDYRASRLLDGVLHDEPGLKPRVRARQSLLTSRPGLGFYDYKGRSGSKVLWPASIVTFSGDCLLVSAPFRPSEDLVVVLTLGPAVMASNGMADLVEV